MTEELKHTLQQAQKGDSEAFARIYDQFSEKLYRFIYFRVGHREIAEDILSDTFVKSWQKIHQINSHKSLSAWLYQIARNNIIDYYRLKKETISLEEVAETLIDAINPIETLNLSFQQKKILAALEDLPTEQKQVIQYRFFEDLSNEEIAFILSKSEGAVRVIQHRAITRLKQLLSKKHEED
jgi:RNA polymerase sigma-70 factor (ECF subfamily)